MIVTSVQIKTAKTQKHLYCLVFTHRHGSPEPWRVSLYLQRIMQLVAGGVQMKVGDTVYDGANVHSGYTADRFS